MTEVHPAPVADRERPHLPTPPTRLWKIAGAAACATSLAKALRCSPTLAQLLCLRGIDTPEVAQQFLEPQLSSLSDPFRLTDMKAAAERILAAIARRESIVIFGDYDVDGITSSALLWRFLRRLGARVECFLPHRVDEGYGLSQDGVERCVADHHPRLLVALDCGTTAVAQIAWLTAAGVETVVVDHHALPPELPRCTALVNPQRDGAFTYLASVGLTWKLCHAICKLLPAERRPDLRDYLDLVAVGTVADIVPLREENRLFVRRGLRQFVQTINPGLRALAEVAQVRGEPSTSEIGFRIGPRLNASGRLGDAMRSLRLLQTDDPAEAAELASLLDQTNRERQAVEQRIVQEAEEQLAGTYDSARDWAIVLAQRGWHCGVVGIVASRIQRMYHRPTVIIGFDETGQGKGSARSIDGFSIVGGLAECRAHLTTFGGHDMAAGLSISETGLAGFRADFNACARRLITEDRLTPNLHLDAVLEVGDVDASLYDELQNIAPFGRDNPEPLFLIRNARCRTAPKFFGKNHVKFFLESRSATGCEAVAFGAAQRPMPRFPAEFAGTLDWDTYHDRVNLRVVDWRAAT